MNNKYKPKIIPEKFQNFWGLFNIINKECHLHPPIFASFHQDIILHIQVVHQWQVRLMNRLIRVWFLNPSQLPNSQYGAYSQHWYIHQCCCVVDCILQILFSSYHISLSSNQSFVTKIRSILISSPCRFHFVLYCFIGFCFPCFALIRVRKHSWDNIIQAKQ